MGCKVSLQFTLFCVSLALKRNTGSFNWVSGVSFSPDSKHVVAADYGGAIRGYTLINWERRESGHTRFHFGGMPEIPASEHLPNAIKEAYWAWQQKRAGDAPALGHCHSHGLIVSQEIGVGADVATEIG